MHGYHMLLSKDQKDAHGLIFINPLQLSWKVGKSTFYYVIAVNKMSSLTAIKKYVVHLDDRDNSLKAGKLGPIFLLAFFF